MKSGKKLNQEIFLCVDCETTGLDVKNDRIIEIAFVEFSLSKIFKSFETLIDVQGEISEESEKIHNISRDMVEGKPKICEVLREIAPLLKGKVVVGHSVSFDVNIIKNEGIRCGIEIFPTTPIVIDTVRLARIYGDFSSNSLESLRGHFNMDVKGAHRAMNDVMANVEIFKKFITKYSSLNQVFADLKNPIELKKMPLGKYKGYTFDKIPLKYLCWLQKNASFDQDLTYTIKKAINRQRKYKEFFSDCNPFKDL